MNEIFPSQTKIVVIGGDLPRTEFGIMRTVLTNRRLTFIQRKNPMALKDALDKIVPMKAKTPGGEVRDVPDVLTNPAMAAALDSAVDKQQAPRGAVSELVKECADLGKGSAEEARRIMRIAVTRGIPTNVASLATAISVLKRKGGRTETPRSIMSAQQKALSTLDESIAGLQLVREYVAETETLNAKLQKKLAKFKVLTATLDEDED